MLAHASTGTVNIHWRSQHSLAPATFTGAGNIHWRRQHAAPAHATCCTGTGNMLHCFSLAGSPILHSSEDHHQLVERGGRSCRRNTNCYAHHEVMTTLTLHHANTKINIIYCFSNFNLTGYYSHCDESMFRWGLPCVSCQMLLTASPHTEQHKGSSPPAASPNTIGVHGGGVI
jgi:hypothetical protein